MPRQNRRRADLARPGRPVTALGERRETWRGEEYAVRGVTAAGAVKEYRCPGCDQVIRVGQAHLVAWREHDHEAGDRRHWHAPCWSARDRRSPNVPRGRSAPRY